MTHAPTPLLVAEGLHKKFSQDIKYNMYYGIVDLVGATLGRRARYDQLRTSEFWALKNISFQLGEGQILGVVGANGSGKTTLMRLLAGIYPLDTGRVLMRPGLRVTAIFALSSGMQPLFTGRENIYIKGSMYGMSRAELDAKMAFIESFSELGDRLDRPFGNYSSGMRARLSYSIAMATEPDVFIIDESLAVGDSAFKTKCIENLQEYVKQPGKGVIFVSNQIRKVQKIADRVLVMDAGQLALDTDDVATGLRFYINNCYRHLNPKARALKLAKVQDFEGGV